MSNIRFTPEELSTALGEEFPPTAQQSEIISAPLEPMLVIAGAGSGKTKTMADKVVWLVANELVRPEQVLGVTFTRKAAGELSARIRAKIATLVSTGLLDAETTQDYLDPAVSTYHSYANTLVQDYGLRLGIEEDSALLGPAQSWELASEVLEAYTGDYEHLGSATSTLVNGIVSFSSEASEHLVTPESAEAWLADLAAMLRHLPMHEGKDKPHTAVAQKLIDKIASRTTIAELAQHYAAEKRRRGVMDYGDLVAHAAQIAQQVPAAALAERSKYKVVLLDEFQDTSHAQMVLFSQLFGNGHPVTAVGDPNQSIYGFRGASAGQLFHFPHQFPIVGEGRRLNAHVKHLTIAWRNTVNVLQAANMVSGSGAPANPAAPVAVKPLEASAYAQPGRVVLNRCATDRQEAEAIAELIGAEREKFAASGSQATAAVLSRNRNQLSLMAQVLDECAIPYQLVGVSGLLSTPEVNDLVAYLHVLVDPLRSDKLMRLLSGARWRLGTADLMAFADWSRFLARRRERALDNTNPDEAGDEALVEDSETMARAEVNDAASLIEALDFLPPEGWTSADGRCLTETGWRRLQAFREELRRLRLLANDDLEALVREVERAMNLDIEVAARPWIEESTRRANLDAFADILRDYSRHAQRADLSGFLYWLEQAYEKEKGLPLPAQDVDPGSVQLLTIHASKGLEWDIVAVMSMNEGVFPDRTSDRWTSGDAALPWPLRGDRHDLPQWDTDQVSFAELLESEKRFAAEVGDHNEEEERRLAYVALTRAKSLLICSCSVWYGTRTKASEPSIFIEQLLPLADGPHPAVEIGVWTEDEQAPQANPTRSQPVEARWPYDPLEGPQVTGTTTVKEHPYSRRMVLQALAEQVGLAPKGREPLTERGRHWMDEADRLLAQRQFLLEQQHTVHAPEHVRASMFVELAENPQEVLENLRRPVPRRPGMAARRGTAFHAWLEEYYEQTQMLDLGDILEPSDAYLDDTMDLESMKGAFLASEWAQRQPSYVEVPLETRIGSVAVRGRVDAVFRTEDGSWLLVDWKTGRVPSGKALKDKMVQLAVYRLGWSRLHSIPLDEIRAAFYYVGAGITIHAKQLQGEQELEQMIASAFEGFEDPVASR